MSKEDFSLDEALALIQVSDIALGTLERYTPNVEASPLYSANRKLRRAIAPLMQPPDPEDGLALEEDRSPEREDPGGP